MMIIYKLHTLMVEQDKEMSYRKLAEFAGVSTTTLTSLLKQRTDIIHRATLEKLCKAFDCQPGDLMLYIPRTQFESYLPDYPVAALNDDALDLIADQIGIHLKDMKAVLEEHYAEI